MLTILEKLKQASLYHSPSGYEELMRAYLKEHLSGVADKIEVDILGNVIAYKYAKNSNTAKTFMLVAHMDEVALMVSYIEENGYLRVSKVGGVDVNIMRGHKVVILHDGKEIHGVIGAVPVHMLKDAPKRDIDFTDLWIDIGVTSSKEASSLVNIGDYVLIDSKFQVLSNNCICFKACDNKAGVVVLWDVLEKISSYAVDYNVVAVFTVQEEVGLRGAKVASHTIMPDICIAVDVAHASDYPSIDKHKYNDITLGNGPIIPLGSNLTLSVQKQLMYLARTNEIPFQRLALPASSGTDINAVQTNGSGCQTGLLSIPCRYMHSPIEVISKKDVEKCIELLLKMVLNVE